MKIYLDMDDVCCDFVGEFLRRVGKPELIETYPLEVSRVSEVVGMSDQEFQDITASWGSEFWRDLSELPWFKEMYAKLSTMGEVHFCTKPTHDPSSLKGKLEWIQDRFGKDFRNYILTPNKELLADHYTILIDDNLENCEKFKTAGGEIVLFPHRSNGTIVKDNLEHVMLEMKDIVEWRRR